MLDIIAELFIRDLNTLRNEISAYSQQENLWKIRGDIKNSGGNLCLHIIGNLQHFIGKVLGNTNYLRNREEEFSKKSVPKEELLKKIDETILIINKTFKELSKEDLLKEYPIEVLGGKKVSTHFFMIHLLTHLNYHLGQINYHRRLIEL